MRDYFNGKRGLSTTYWVGVFGVNILTRFVFRMVNKGYLTIQDEAKFAQLEMFHNVFLVVLCVYMLLMVRAMFKAGYDDRTPGGWGWTGIVLTTVSALYTIYMTATVLFPSMPTPQFMLEIELLQLNKQLPQDMGDGVTMTKVEIEDNVLYYRFRVDSDLTESGRALFQESILETPDGKELCEDYRGYFNGGLEAMSFEYTFDNESINQNLVGHECLEWLDQQ